MRMEISWRKFVRLWIGSILFIGVTNGVLAAPSNTDKKLTISSGLGMTWGTAREIVQYPFSLKYPTKNDYYSLLLWELKAIMTWDSQFRYDFTPIFGMEIRYSMAFPNTRSGIMYDYDWFFTDMDWSHRSIHDIWLNIGMKTEVAFDWEIAKYKGFAFRLGVAYHMDLWSWRDKITSVVHTQSISGVSYPLPYADYSNTYALLLRLEPEYQFRNLNRTDLNGKNGIDYVVSYHSILTVFMFGLEGRVLSIWLTGRIGPAMVLALDHHMLSRKKYYEIGFSMPWVDASLDFGIKLHSNFILTLRGEIAFLNDGYANITTKDSNENFIQYSPSGGGAGFIRGGVSILISANL